MENEIRETALVILYKSISIFISKQIFLWFFSHKNCRLSLKKKIWKVMIELWKL